MLRYRLIKKSDISKIRSVALQCWLDAYKQIYKESIIKKFIANFYSMENIDKSIQNTNNKKAWFCIVLDHEKVIGFSHIGKKEKDWELFRIYILPSYQRKGIGLELIRKCEKFLKSKNLKSYLVYSHSKNKLAIKFYKKLGFIRQKNKDRGNTSYCFKKII
tara:strand:+ start:58 stop:540 length:483 start_codon:yes stop_codon:yes gene_type:complete